MKHIVPNALPKAVTSRKHIMKRSIFFALSLLMLVLFSACQDNSTEPDVSGNLELNGTWFGTDFHPTNGDNPLDFVFSFTNSVFSLTYDGDAMVGSILAFDNTTNTLVFKWTTHPVLQDKYQKFTWIENRLSQISLQAYAEQESQAAASSTTELGGYLALAMQKENSMACAAPTFSPESGTHAGTQTIIISCTTSGASIRYTLDGSTPGSNSALYSTHLLISARTTIKAKAYKAGWLESALATAAYTITDPPVSNFVFVQGGTFNPTDHDGSQTDYHVTLSSFFIDKFEVTQSEYQAVMGSNPANGYGVGSNYPVYLVTWFNAIEYCNRRSMLEGLLPCYSYSSYGTDPSNWPAGWSDWMEYYPYSNHELVSCNWNANGYRLPTEMEWMFAAKGGNQSQGYTYSGSNTIGNVAWYYDNSDSTTHTVGTKAANELGLYDMTGNVWEYVWDIYGDYPSGSYNNPTGANSGLYHMFRGGSWYNNADYCTVSICNLNTATDSYIHIGFRCVRDFP